MSLGPMRDTSGSYHEPIQDWRARQGGPAHQLRTKVNGQWNSELSDTLLFPNGARCGFDGSGRMEPSPDPVESAEWCLHWEELHSLFIHDHYRSLQQYIHTQSHWHERGVGPSVEERVFADLETMQADYAASQKKVKSLRRKLVAARKKYKRPNPVNVHQRQKEEREVRARDDVLRMRAITDKGPSKSVAEEEDEKSAAVKVITRALNG